MEQSLHWRIVFCERRCLLALVAFSLIVCIPTAAEAAELTGRVRDENSSPVAGARVSLRHSDGDGIVGTATSEVDGRFTIHVLPGQYWLSAERVGFLHLQKQAVEIREESAAADVVLFHPRQTSQSIDVSAVSSSVDLEQTSSERQLTGRQILDVPYPATRNFRNALRIMPGVLQDAGGGLHFDGGMENQVFYSLDGFNIGDPITGRFTTRLTVEAVRSVDYSSGRYSPEFGKGSAGALAIQTVNGDDVLRYSVTNFIPGIETQKGLHVGNWSPRFNVSGPIRRGRAWFSESVDGEYNQALVPDLPAGQDRTTRIRGGSILHGQVNATPSSIVSLNLLGSFERAPRSGLSALDPVSTSVNRGSQQWFFGLRDQIYLRRGVLLEAGYARTRTQAYERPQGTEDYVITPNGRRGNYFVNSVKTSQRDQVLLNMFLPAWEGFGRHQIKLGLDLDLIQFWQNSHRTAFENYGVRGNLLSRTTFGGSSGLNLENREASSYIVDAWKVRSNLVIEYGLRQDWDRLVDRIMLSPRLAIAYSPRGWKQTKFMAGYAIIHDASSLDLFSRPLDQYGVTTTYTPGGTVAREPSVTVFRILRNGYGVPRYRTWSFGWEQQLSPHLRITTSLLRRRGANGFTYVGVASDSGAESQNVYVLSNLRRDQYDAAAVTVHHSFGREFQWMLNYTRSRAASNAVIDISADQILQVRENVGRLSWDAPHRFLSWGYLPAWGPNWAIAYLADLRSGFPFSVVRETGEVVGAVNSRRFPTNFDLNLHLERRFRLGKYRFAIRGGLNNITNAHNATGVNNVVDSPQFLAYYGKEGRHAVFRLRWLTKE